MNVNEMIWIDLPSLFKIELGEFALCGRKEYDSNSLVMQSNNDMGWNDWM